MLGDVPVISRQAQKQINCNSMTEFQNGDIRYGIIADCEIPRAKELTIVRTQTGQTLYLNAEEYGYVDDRHYTSLLNVQEKSGAFNLSLYIDDITIPWKGSIDFTIPVNYKIER
jgi:hypothetical protein